MILSQLCRSINEGYYTFGLDQNEYGGGILLYIPSKLLSMRNSIIEYFFTELNLRKKK